jgi:7,8-dihydropterin-6-yl-methyl-4-(beta-D-ribofuranosyl)aminobenzene 5'-phosphate synthase
VGDDSAAAPVDEVIVTTLVDNIYDALLASNDTITRAPFAAGAARAPQFESGSTHVGLIAEHGYSAMITVRRGKSSTSVLFDTGLSPGCDDHQRRPPGPRSARPAGDGP